MAQHQHQLGPEGLAGWWPAVVGRQLTGWPIRPSKNCADDEVGPRQHTGPVNVRGDHGGVVWFDGILYWY